MQDVKMMEQTARRENAGRKNARHAIKVFQRTALLLSV